MKKEAVEKRGHRIFPGYHPVGSIILEITDSGVEAIGMLVKIVEGTFVVKWSDRKKLYHYGREHYFMDSPTKKYELIEP